MVFDRRGVSSLEACPPTAAGAEGVGEGPNEDPGHPLGSASCMRSIGSEASSSDVDLSLDPINQLGDFNNTYHTIHVKLLDTFRQFD